MCPYCTCFILSLGLIEVHCHQELTVGSGLGKPALEQLDCFDGVQFAQNPSESIYELKLFRIEQQLLPPGSASADVYSRVDPSVNKTPVKMQFHISGRLELFEDHLVHFRAGVD